MSEPAIALVFSPEPWVERLHRHLADHGGARVRQIVLDPTLAFEEHYDVLVVSHRWPGLTHRLVSTLAERGRAVLGVFDPDEPAGRDHLMSLGVAHVVSSDAPATQVVEVLAVLPRAAPVDVHADLRADRIVADGDRRARGSLVVTGAAGAGVTEVALAVAHACSRRRATVLVDAQERGASIALRLGLPLEPGLRDAVDAVEHAAGALNDSMTRVAPRFDVLPGMVAGALAPVPAHEASAVVAALVDTGRAVIVDAAADSAVGRALVPDADVVVFVAGASPLGVARTLAWASDHPSSSSGGYHVLLNRAPRERFRRGELERELVRTLGAVPVWFAPSDARVETAAWDGELVRRGPFSAAMERLAAAVLAAPGRHERRPGPRRRARSAA